MAHSCVPEMTASRIFAVSDITQSHKKKKLSKTNISFTYFVYSGLDLISLKICSFFPSFISFHRDKTLNEPTSVAINHTFTLLSGQMCAGQAQQKMKYRMKVLCSGLVNNMESCLSVQFYSFTANWYSLCTVHICGALLHHTI